MNAMLASALCAPAEALINAVLKQDPASALALQTYRGKALRIDCTTPLALTVFLVVEDHGFSLRSVYEEEPDASISASAGSFATLMLSESQSSALFSPAIALGGDTQLIQGLHRIINGLEIDWQGHFAPLIGDSATHQFSELVSRAQRWGKQSRDAIIDDIEEYLHEEARILPSKSEMAHFSTRVDELKLHLDRVQARTQRLANHVSETGSD